MEIGQKQDYLVDKSKCLLYNYICKLRRKLILYLKIDVFVYGRISQIRVICENNEMDIIIKKIWLSINR